MKDVFKFLVLLIAVVVGIFGGTDAVAGLMIAAPPVVLDTQKIVFLC